MLPSSTWLLAFAGGVIFGLGSSSALGQDETFAIRTAFIAVSNAEGAGIEGLQREDFDISERGIARDVVEAAEEGIGGELYLLVDTSIAFEPHVFLLRQSLRAFVDALGSRFRVSLYEFGARPRRLAGPTADPVELSRAIGTVMAHPEGAYLLDALRETSRAMNETERGEGTPPLRVVIITGSGPELSHASDIRALEDGRSTGAVFDVIRYEGAQAGDFMQRARVDDVLDRLSTESGGSLDTLLSVNALEGALVRLASEQLRPTYRVSFLTELSPETDTADLQVTVRRAGAEAVVIRLLPGERRVEPDRP
ncbi:MAG: hypothetical protein ACRD1X_16310 [Vicinamibacteria bacterium]